MSYGLLPDIVGYDPQTGAPIMGAGGSRLNPSNEIVARFQIASGDEVTVGANATARLTVSVQAPFRPDFMVLTTSVSGKSNVRVKSVKVGTQEQLVGKSSDISVDVFAPGNLLGRIQFNTASPGVDIVIDLENTSSTAENISCAFYGTRLERA